MDARTSRYHEVYARWQRDPEGFWAEAAQAIDWIEPPKQVFDPDAGVYGRWFVDGVCNTCWNAVDRHVMRGRGEQPAIIYDFAARRAEAHHHLSPPAGRDAGARRASCAISASRRATASFSTCRWCRRR